MTPSRVAAGQLQISNANYCTIKAKRKTIVSYWNVHTYVYTYYIQTHSVCMSDVNELQNLNAEGRKQSSMWGYFRTKYGWKAHKENTMQIEAYQRVKFNNRLGSADRSEAAYAAATDSSG